MKIRGEPGEEPRGFSAARAIPTRRKDFAMTTNRRSRRPRRDDAFWTEYVRAGSFDPATPAAVTPTVAEAELLLEEARQAEAEQAEALAREAEEAQRRRASVERETAADVDALEARLDAEITAMRTAEIPADRELRILTRGFLHGFAPRSIKRMPPQDMIAARDAAAAHLLEVARDAELMYDRLTGSWSEVPLAADHPFVLRADAVEIAAWRAFVERVKVIAGESHRIARGVAPHAGDGHQSDPARAWSTG
jgi:hypothetical protein